MRTARNVAIVMLLALGVAFVPGGGSAAEAVLTAMTLGFLAAISWMLYTLGRQQRLTIDSLGDGRRAILYGALGVIALLVAATDELFSSGLGTFAWLLLLGGSIAAIWQVWREATTY